MAEAKSTGPTGAPLAGERGGLVGGRVVSAAAMLVGAGLLLLSFAPLDQSYAAYFALAVWGFGVLTCRHARWAMLWAYLSGVAFWAAGAYWLTWVTIEGYLALAFYLGVYFLAAAWLLRRAHRRAWPMWLVLPVAWVALEYARAWVISGFPWFNMAHSQYRNLRIIQVADATGQYGVSFFVAMVNGLALDWAMALWRGRTGQSAERRVSRKWLLAGTATVAVCLAGLVGYGSYRLAQETQSPGPAVGLVQEAFPNSVSYENDDARDVFETYLERSRELVGQRLDLVVWPESMLVYRDFDPEIWRRAQWDELADSPEVTGYVRDMRGRLNRFEGLVRDLGCPVLAGGSTQASPAGQREGLRRNSAILYKLDDRGRLKIDNIYSKTRLVPFGEYVPFGRGDSFEIPRLHRWLRSFVPESMPQLEPGTGAVSFSLAPGSQARFAVPICYEGVFDRYCRTLAYWGGRKQADLLVNISNDGWFVHVQPGRATPSTELDQHLAQYVFRAIENRLPVVRAVNVGISGQIDSNGRIIKVIHQDDRKTMVAGTLVAQTLVDSRRSPYSLVGDGFAQLVCLVAVFGAALLLRASYLDRKGGE